MARASFIDVLLAIILPPLGVFLAFGCAVSDFTSSIVFSFQLDGMPTRMSFESKRGALSGGTPGADHEVDAGGVLDMSAADHLGVRPRHHICHLRSRRLNKSTSNRLADCPLDGCL